MENSGRFRGDSNLIAGNSRLDSDVPIQYFSWAEYPLYDPSSTQGDIFFNLKFILKTGSVVAVISNCEPQFRLEVLHTLIALGPFIEISFKFQVFQLIHMGQCLNNKNDPDLEVGSFNEKKMKVIST